MISQEAIKHRALMMALATGNMPEVGFIWKVQHAEGRQACFGQGAECIQEGCRWRTCCVTLEHCEDLRLPIAPMWRRQRPVGTPATARKETIVQSFVGQRSAPAGARREHLKVSGVA